MVLTSLNLPLALSPFIEKSMASRIGVFGSRIWSPCLVVPLQDALG